jgi:hypothetical protein
MDLFYDALRFNHHSESAPASGFGGAICLENIFYNCLKSKLSLTERALFNQVHADVSWLAISCPDMQLEIVFGVDYFAQPFIIKNESVVTLKLVYHWDHTGCVRHCLFAPNDTDNIHWASQPVVRFPQTMVMRDERVEVN